MEFDESAVRYIRRTFDPGLVPFHRVMIFRGKDGGEIRCHNWGIARYSEKGVQNELLRRAPRPSYGYFSKLEHPTDVDGIYPFGEGMNKDGIPPAYEPFIGEMVIDHCRRVFGLAIEKYEQRVAERKAERESEIETLLDVADQKFADMIPRSDWSTAVRPTPVKDQIKGEVNAQSAAGN